MSSIQQLFFEPRPWFSWLSSMAAIKQPSTIGIAIVSLPNRPHSTFNADQGCSSSSAGALLKSSTLLPGLLAASFVEPTTSPLQNRFH